jgi:hypothetical protein
MPPRRQLGTETSGITPRGPNLTPIQRQQIISKAEAGVSVQELVEEFGRSPNRRDVNNQTNPNMGYQTCLFDVFAAFKFVCLIWQGFWS